LAIVSLSGGDLTLRLSWYVKPSPRHNLSLMPRAV
jgi:hypothetical protein